MKHAKTTCPLSVAKAIDALRGELLAHYACDFAFTVMARGHQIAACNYEVGDVRPVPHDPETQAEEREAEIERANPLEG